MTVPRLAFNEFHVALRALFALASQMSDVPLCLISLLRSLSVPER